MADQEKKQVPLRISSKLYAEIASWAEDDFRSLNGQVFNLSVDGPEIVFRPLRQIVPERRGNSQRNLLFGFFLIFRANPSSPQ